MIELHFNQQEIYFDHLLDSKNPQYNVGTYVVINGNLNVELFKRAIISSGKVFDVFKFKSFSSGEPSAYLQDSPSSIQITELDFTSENWSEELIKQWLKERINKPFDIQNESLYDFVLIKVGEKEYWFYMGCHHLFIDGYGVSYVFLSYVFDKYHALRIGEEKEFEYPSYLQLIEKSNNYLGSKNYENDRDYWKKRFSIAQEPILQKVLQTNTFRTDSAYVFFSQEEQKRLKSFCLKNQISLQDLLIGVLAVYYKKANGIDFFDFSLPIHNRSDRKERQTLGVFSKVIPCRIEINNPKLNELFKTIKANQRQDYRHKQFPVSHFNRMIQAETGNSSRPFDIRVHYRYYKLDTAETELSLRGFRNEAMVSKVPIEYGWCDFAENGSENLYLEIAFREDYFTKAEIELMGQRILFIIEQFYHATDNDINTINILPETERKQLLNVFNDTRFDYPKNKTIIDLFEEQVIRTPDNIAVAFEEESLTYKELNEKSNQLAHYLQKNYGIQPDDLIGIKQQRSEWMLISILGILKSGGAYVPIDTEYPRDRIEFIENDTACKVCIDKNELSKFVKDQEQYIKKNRSSFIKPSNLAYVIYTSGTTGKPKGVMIEHAGMLNHLYVMSEELELDQDSVIVQNAPSTFDISVWQLLNALMVGGTTVIYSNKTILNPEFFVKSLGKDKATILQVVPSYLKSILDIKWEGKKEVFKNLKYLLVTGEAVDKDLLNELFSFIPGINVVNAYGPAEASDDVTLYFMEKAPETNNVSVGKPIKNIRICILNENNELCPIGVRGEICVSGIGLARGYLNNEVLTRKKFVEDPYYSGEKIYKTGDIGCWLPDGNIDYIGRRDDQVKIRGYRIELGEIESALRSYDKVEEAVVIARSLDDSGKELIAYIVSKEKLISSDLRNFLSKSVPLYFIPGYFVQIEKIPLSHNGKIDRKCLPNPLESAMASGVEYLAPRNEIERKLVEIWSEVLGADKDKIGIKDNFFDLGGHSLKAVIVKSKIHQCFNIELNLELIFNYPDIETLSKYIEAFSITEGQLETNEQLII